MSPATPQSTPAPDLERAQRHVPELASRWVAEAPEAAWQFRDGTLCFADISGFTALAERLAERGRMGGEELVETLGRVFTGMLGVARARGGSLLKFGGDALLLFFEGDDHPRQAACAAVEMRQALRRAADIPTSVGPLRLRMSVGLHCGDTLFLLVGEPHRELMLAGPAIDAVLDAESRAEAGQIALSPAMVAALPATAISHREDGQALLRWRRAARSAGQITPPHPLDPLVNPLLPSMLESFLAAGAPDPEHRIACIAFARLSGTDDYLARHGPMALADALHQQLTSIIGVLEDEAITLLAVDVDRDGAKLFMAAGVPNSHEDDEGAMLRALRRIIETPLPLPLQIGVNRGHVFAAEVGDARRAAYSAMGDTTNTAARIAAHTPPGAIYAHPTVLDESFVQFQATAAEPLSLKGKRAPLVVYQVGPEIGVRDREGLETGDLVGRRTELSLLVGAWEDSATDGSVVTVLGEAGIGKTRLLRELLTRPEPAGVLALRGEPYGTSTAYRLLRDPLRAALGIEARHDLPAALAAAVAARAPALGPWLPLLGDLAQIPVPLTPEVEAIEARFRPQRTAEVLVDLLGALRTEPWVIVVDDAHWCDDASAQVLGHIADACARLCWLMVVARRDVAGGLSPEPGSRLRLTPMGDAEIRDLLLSVTEAAPLRPHEVDRIVRRAGGNPLFAEEAVRAMREVGSLDAVPESLQGAMAARVDALDRGARRVLQYAAVLGYSFATDALAELLASENHVLDPAHLERLDEFLVPDGERRLRMHSGLMRDTIYEGISFRLRKRLHAAAAEVMERRSLSAAAIADLLTLHHSRAGNVERTWHFGRLSGDQARDKYANADAARLYELALEAARRLPAVDARARIAANRDLGSVYLAAGQLEDALEAHRKALTLAGRDPLLRAEALYHLARTMDYGGRLSGALRNLSQARTLLATVDGIEARQMEARIASQRAIVLQGLDRPVQALVQAEHAAALAEASQEQAALARSLAIIELAGLQLSGPGDGSRLRRALGIYESLGDVGAQAASLANLGVIAAIAGRWHEAADAFREARDFWVRAGNAVEGALSGRNLGELLISQGRLAEAERVLRDAERVMLASRWSEGVAVVQTLIGQILIERGDLAAADRMLAEASAEFGRLGQPQTALETIVIRAAGRVLGGDPESAGALLDEGIAGAGNDSGMLGPRILLVRALALTHGAAHEQAAAACREGLAAARRFGLPYEEGLLALALSDIGLRAGVPADDPALEESMARLQALGVVEPPKALTVLRTPD